MNAASFAHRQFLMGIQGEMWDTARLAVSSQERLKMLYEFEPFRNEIEKTVNKAIDTDGTDVMTLAASFISMCRNGSGQQHFDRLCRGANEVYSFDKKRWIQRKITAGRLSFKKFRMRLTRHMLNKGKSFIIKRWGHLLPTLTPLYEDGKNVGAMADFYVVALNAAISALGRAKYQKDFINKEIPELPPDHVWLIVGGGDDGLPFRTIGIDGFVQGSLAISNLCGAAHATENMWAWLCASCDEHSFPCDVAHRMQEEAFDKMKLSDSADAAAGIPIAIPAMPSNARYAHTGTVNKPHTLYVHFALGHLLRADGKSQSGAFDHSFSLASKDEGGQRVKGLRKDRILTPDVPITDNPDDPLSWMTYEYCCAQASKVADFIKTLPAALDVDARHKRIAQFCKGTRNMFSAGLPPYRYAMVGFMDNLHCDMLEGEVQCKAYDEFCDQHDGASAFHTLLCASGSYGLKKKGTALINQHSGETDERLTKCRLMGDDVLDWFELFPRLLDLVLELAGDDEGSRYAALGMMARIHMHRCMSSMYSRHTMPTVFIDFLIAMGNDVQRLLFHTVQHATFTTAYWTKVNPSLLKKVIESIKITEHLCFGLGALASCQGFERLHAWLKLMFRLLTHGREGSHASYLLSRFMFQICGEQGDFDVPSNYSPDRRHRFADEDGLDIVTGEKSTSKHNKSASLKPSVGPQQQSQCSCCTRSCNEVVALAAHPDDPPHFKCYRFSTGPICQQCTMLANFIRQACSHGKTPTGEFGGYLSRAESRVALARANGRIEENFEDRLVAGFEAQSERNPTGAVGDRDMDADDEESTTTTTTTANAPSRPPTTTTANAATRTTTTVPTTTAEAEESVLDGIAISCGFDLEF